MSRRKRRRAWKRHLERNRVVVHFPRPWERRDGISPGRLVAWGEWKINRKGEENHGFAG